MGNSKTCYEDLFELKKTRTKLVMKFCSSGKMSWATGMFYVLFTDTAHTKYPINQLSFDEVKDIKKQLNCEPSIIDYHIRNLKKLNLLSTIYEFETDEGKTLKVNNYKAALKLGVRGMKNSYLIFKDIGGNR